MQFAQLIEFAAANLTVPASAVAKVCKEDGMSSVEFCDVFARAVANGYLKGTYSWAFGDAAMNGLSGYGFSLSEHHNLPDFAFGVFLAFDAGETLLPPDNEVTTKEQLLRLLNTPNQLPDPTSPSVTPPACAGGAPSVAADH
jgi:hypothetical protein